MWMGLWMLWACGTAEVRPPYEEVTVVRGDTLFLIAKAHGTTVAALREANGIEGDLIEVGQVLRIPRTAVVAPTPRPVRPRPQTPAPAQEGHGLRRPSPKPCRKAPEGTDLAEDGLVASQGLTGSHVREVMSTHLSHTLRCPAAEPSWPTGSVTAELTVACDGTVASVRVLSSEGLASSTVDCVVDVLGYAGFDAHDLPDGYVFTQPVQFAP